MEFSMKSSGTRAAAGVPLSTDRLSDAPLGDLLAQFDVEVTTSSIQDPTFTGAAVVRADGSLLFTRPPGRPESEWEITARAMLGHLLHVPTPTLPPPFEITEL
jgi:hypothetical protein